MKKLLSGNTEHGFSLIELLVVAAIITTLLSIGVSALVTYSNVQTFNSKVAEMVTTLETAKTYAQSQVKKCSDTFVGYRVTIDTTTSYSLSALCRVGTAAPTATLVETKTLRAPLSVTSVVASPFPAEFYALTGSAKSASVIVKGYNRCQTISVNAVGNITVAQVLFSPC